MPRVSKHIKELAETHARTMKKYPSFMVWERKHLRCRDRIGDYEKAFDYVSKKDEQEAIELRPVDKNEHLSSLRPTDEQNND